jgi:hypothetical protein
MARSDGTLEIQSFPYSKNPRTYTFKNSTDTLATILASGYFDNDLTAYSFQLNDWMYIVASDGQALVKITAVSPNVTVANFLDATIHSVTVSVTSAQILAMRATPVTLLAAPGAGLFYQFLGAQLILDYNSAAYVESADNMAVRYTDGSGVIVSQNIEATAFLTATADTITNAEPKIDAIVAATGAVNQALVLHNIGDGEYTTGDSPMSVIVNYRLHLSGL